MQEITRMGIRALQRTIQTGCDFIWTSIGQLNYFFVNTAFDSDTWDNNWAIRLFSIFGFLFFFYFYTTLL